MPKCHETAHFFQSSTGGSLLLSPYICSNIQNLMSSWKCSTQLIFISTYRLAPIYFFAKNHPVPISQNNFKDMTTHKNHFKDMITHIITNFHHHLHLQLHFHIHYILHILIFIIFIIFIPQSRFFLNKDVPKKHMQMLISK